jgi:mannose-1-phosphate guanylyltransferase/mannose-6-phosphate isomerase
MSILQAVILSGGSGSRLWPASRAMRPKQLLSLYGKQTMLQDTAARLDGLAGDARPPIVVCNEAHRFLVAQQLEGIGCRAEVLVEPEGRNTAPAAAIAALHALQNAPGDDPPVLLVMPADHVIRDLPRFYAAVQVALGAALEGSLVTFGVVPQAAHTGYGYIEADAADDLAVPVRSFVEKPDLETATGYVSGGRHFWNGGIFIFRADTYLDELEKHAPQIVAACREAMAAAETNADFLRPGRDAFLSCPPDSIDYAVMEKTENAVMVKLDAGWSDVGSWSALHGIAEKDSAGNVVSGDSVLVDCTDSYISSDSRLVAAVGVDNLVIIETKDSVAVVNMDRSEDVRKLVDQLKDAGRAEVSLARQVYRPWGSYDSLDADDGFQVKRLIVNPGAVLSLQMHHRRAEHWVVVRGTARVTLNDDEFDLHVNESTFIPVGARHRIANAGSEPVHIIEVQCGDYLGEDDIVRFEDQYGREGTNT